MKVTQSCLALCDLIDYIVHGILQARILEWVAFPFSRGSSQPRDQTQISCIAGGFFTNWAIYQGSTIWAELSGKDLSLCHVASARLDIGWFAPRMTYSQGGSFGPSYQLVLRKGWWPGNSVPLCLGSLLWAFPEASSWFPQVTLSWLTEQVSQENRKGEQSIFIT